MNKLVSSAVAVLLATSGMLFVGQAANATPHVTCTIVVVTPEIPAKPAVPAVAAVEEVSHIEKGELISPAVEAVPSQWWVWAPQGSFDGTPTFPSTAERGKWVGPKTSDDGPEEDGTTFNPSKGDNGKGAWFHREPAVEAKDAVYAPDEKVIDVVAVPGTPEVPAVPAVPAVTKEECTTPEEPEVPVVPETPVVVETPLLTEVPVPTCADLGLVNIPKGFASYFAQNDADADGVACESGVARTEHVAESADTLAETGANENMLLTGGIATLLLGAGAGLLRLRSKLS